MRLGENFKGIRLNIQTYTNQKHLNRKYLPDQNFLPEKNPLLFVIWELITSYVCIYIYIPIYIHTYEYTQEFINISIHTRPKSPPQKHQYKHHHYHHYHYHHRHYHHHYHHHHYHHHRISINIQKVVPGQNLRPKNNPLLFVIRELITSYVCIYIYIYLYAYIHMNVYTYINIHTRPKSPPQKQPISILLQGSNLIRL
jgi:hypothetical protein